LSSTQLERGGGGRQQQQQAGVARSGQDSFGHLYGALRPPLLAACALGAVEVLTTANPALSIIV